MKYSRDEQRSWHNSLPAKPNAANILLWNDKGELLIGKPNYREHWNLPGGVVDASESPLDAALREAKEEFDITVPADEVELKLVHYTPENDGFHDFVTYIFEGGIVSESQIKSIKLQAEEMDEYRFVSVDEAKLLLSELRAHSLDAILGEAPTLFINSA